MMKRQDAAARGSFLDLRRSRYAAAAASAVLWLLGLLIPFISGSKNLWVASPSRAFNLPKFVGMLLDDGQSVTALAVLLFLVAAPLALFALLALVELRPTGRKRRRLAIGACALLLVDLIFLMAIRAGVDEKATPHLLPGFWLLLGGLLVAAAAASWAAWAPRGQRLQGVQPSV